MSVRPHSDSSATTLYRTASYMACDDCGEGAMVWDDAERRTKCHACGTVYEGRPEA